MIYAAICRRELTYRYRTSDIPEGAAPAPEDFDPINGQTSVAQSGQKAICDLCGSDLTFVRGTSWEMLMGQTNGRQADSRPPLRSGGGIWEVFHVESGEDVKETRDLPGERLLVVTTRRIVVIDPNLVGGP